MKHLRFNCNRCFFTCDDDEQRMKNHCLKCHGVTGLYKKGYKISKVYR